MGCEINKVYEFHDTVNIMLIAKLPAGWGVKNPGTNFKMCTPELMIWDCFPFWKTA
jgi:hypothetical protein